MKYPFRQYHLLQILEEYDEEDIPLDLCIARYFRQNKALGSKDRAEIAGTAYGLIRWKGLVDAQLDETSTWEERLNLYLKLDFDLASTDEKISSYQQVSFPEELFVLLAEAYGEERAKEICLHSNQEAPMTIRANETKISRDELIERLPKDEVVVKKTSKSPWGITFSKRRNLFTLPQFKEGLFEVQDEASQLVANLVNPKPGDSILDFCAGSGGKTLAFAHKLQGKGQLYLHDIRKHILIEAKRRLKRAGIQNAQVIDYKSEKLKKLKKKMNWVLVDAPCSGTGTLRRNPDMKWRFDCEMLQRLQGQQRTIFEQALSYVKPGGHIVYSTCSILPQENQEQVEHFLKTYNLEMLSPSFQSFPEPNEGDGFFAAVFKLRIP
ncbi:MAG: SAM-dependent methyltransferase [Waddliaceae bacterium]|nr:SAM-dependent methyltransferase [Waddliaceae bacterium]